jgi:hypothetical protein
LLRLPTLEPTRPPLHLSQPRTLDPVEHLAAQAIEERLCDSQTIGVWQRQHVLEDLFTGSRHVIS